MTGEPSDARASLDQVNHVSESMEKAPMLSRALLEGPVGTHDAFRTTLEKSGRRVSLTSEGFDGELRQILGHVEERLKLGLTEAWFGPHAYDFKPPALKPGQVVSNEEIRDLVKVMSYFSSPEESWARAFTEMVVFTMYGGSGETYFNEAAKDRTLFEAFSSGFYPIALACQHLSTMCILSRGFPLALLSTSFAVGCGCTGGTTAYKVFEKKATFHKGVTDDGIDYRPISALVDILSPGDVVIFNPGGPTTTRQDHGPTTHIGSVLRKGTRRLQFIDTGVLTGDETERETLAEVGTVDHSFALSEKKTGRELSAPWIKEHKSMIAWATIPKATDLAGCAAKTSLAKPLGVVRLVLLDVSDARYPEVRYISKLLHMRYPLSRLIWSLRALPIDDLVALWYVYLPKRKWATALLNAADPPAPPAALFLEDTKNPFDHQLHLANVIRGNAHQIVKDDVWVFRNKNKGYVKNFAGNESDNHPEMARSIPLALSYEQNLGMWCASPASFGKQYIRRPGADQGTVEEGATGVAFFEP